MQASEAVAIVFPCDVGERKDSGRPTGRWGPGKWGTCDRGCCVIHLNIPVCPDPGSRIQPDPGLRPR